MGESTSGTAVSEGVGVGDSVSKNVGVGDGRGGAVTFVVSVSKGVGSVFTF